jgi:hypothetical protein
LSKKLQEAFSPSKDNIQHFKKRKFINLFLRFLVFFALLEPDPDRESEYGSKDPIESGSTALSVDTKHLFERLEIRFI